MKEKGFFWISIFCLSLLFACYKKDSNQLDFFYLQNKNVYMPVWVKGNTNADQIIIMIHGGPGGDDGIYMHLDSFFKLQQDYLMVYYDQRASGASQSSLVSNYSAQQHIEDLEKLVQLVQDRYGKTRKINLMGHSWGGMLGGLYLQKGRNREMIQGFINVDGAYETITKAEYQAIFNTAHQEINAGRSVSFWERMLKKLQTIDTQNLSMEDLSKINAWGYDGEAVLQQDGVITSANGFDLYNYFYNSSFHPSIYALNELFINSLMFRQAYAENLSLKDNIDQLKTPTCLLWGRHDLIVAANTVLQLSNELPNKVHQFFFEYSGHSPMITEPTAFVEQVGICMQLLSEI